MPTQNEDLEPIIYKLAERAISQYAREILSVEVLTLKMKQEWEERRVGADEPSKAVFTRIAQRICSSALYEAWRSPDIDTRNRAFDNLRRYLKEALNRSTYAESLRRYAIDIEDVLHQAIADLQLALNQNSEAGPNDPAAFLKWTLMIGIRHAYAFIEKKKRETYISFEAQPEALLEQFIDQELQNPQEYVLNRELQEVLKNAILSLSNLRYRQVLLYIYLAEMDESELARHLRVPVQDIYLWRHRALKALRKNPEVMAALRRWLL